MSARQRRRLVQSARWDVAAISDDEGPSLARPAFSFAALGEASSSTESSDDADEGPSSRGPPAVRERLGASKAIKLPRSLPAPENEGAPAPPLHAAQAIPSGALPLTVPAQESILFPENTEAASQSRAAATLSHLLLVSSHHLNPDNEVHAVLGGQRAGAAASGLLALRFNLPGSRAAGGRGGRGGGHLVTADPSWVAAPSRSGGGFSMVRAAVTASTAAAAMQAASLLHRGITPVAAPSVAFAIEYSAEYRRAQRLFDECASSGDPRSIMQLLQLYPYHLDGLLQLAEFYRTTRQHEAAAGALRNAAFVVEAAWHPRFRPWERSCHLEAPAAPPARLAVRVLQHLMQHAGRNAAPRAAFELARLLLQLSFVPPQHHPGGGGGGPARYDDPTRALLCIDYFAHRCGQLDFLVALTGPAPAAAGDGAGAGTGAAPLPLCTLRGSSVPAGLLPNLALSRALALFRLEQQQQQALADGPAMAGLGGLLRGAPNLSSLPLPARRDIAGIGGLRLSPPTAAQSPPQQQQQRAPTSAELTALHADMGHCGYGATRSLARALLLYPCALAPLLEAVGVTAATVGTDVAGGAAAAAVAAAAAGAPGDTAGAGAGHPDCPAPALRAALAWRHVLTHPLFAGPVEAAEAAALAAAPELARLVAVMAARHHGLWRAPDVLAWLFVGACHAAYAADAADALQLLQEEEAGAALPAAAALPQPSGRALAAFRARVQPMQRDWAARCCGAVPPERTFPSPEEAAAECVTAGAVRRQLFAPHDGPWAGGAGAGAGAPFDAAGIAAAVAHYASAPLADFTDEVASFAAEDLEDRPGQAEAEELARLQRQHQQRQQPHAGGGGGGGGGLPYPARPLDLGAHPLLVFLRSLLPWTVVPGAPPVRDPLRDLML